MGRHSTSFLDLPPTIRQRIYEHANLLTGENILLGPKWGRDPDYSQFWIEPEQFDLAHSLLRTCKAIYTEVQSFLYAKNGIVVLHDNVEDGLSTVRRMTQEQCHNLRDLYVHLHVKGSDPHETLSSQRIAAWRETARHVLSRVSPGTLSLHLICDTGYSEETHAVLEPLLAFAGTLKACELRLGSKRDSYLVNFAHETVARIEARNYALSLRNKPFRFLDLPAELRLHVLRYTDLVTPYNEVEWNPQQGFRVLDPTLHAHHVKPHADLCRDIENRLYKGVENPFGGTLYRSCRFFRCKPDSAWETGDFCGRSRSAYSPACQCWILPGPLMVVCRTMYAHAIEILYSCNRIVLTPPYSPNRFSVIPSGNNYEIRLSPDRSPPRLDAARFITRHMWPRQALQHLRCLEIVLPKLDPLFCPDPSSPLYLDWRFAIDHLKAHANLSVLTIIVHFSLDNRDRPPWFGYSERTRKWGRGREGMMRPHMRLLTPLQAMRQTERLFIHLEWLWRWKPYKHKFWIDWYGSCLEGRENEFFTDIETWLEHIVMGDEYDSLAVGKAEERPSEWLKKELRLRILREVPQSPFYNPFPWHKH
ncbi:hypothetical protein HD806DRAFT_508632 [Xylariaceae sp. AK1471]|nr:hypothetical protein HD806DRAFT_508632 [Xylariaceae sp. AK1471]